MEDLEFDRIFGRAVYRGLSQPGYSIVKKP